VDVVAVQAVDDAHVARIQDALGKMLAGSRQRYPHVGLRSIIAREHPTDVLLDRSQDAQLVVVGSHDRGRLASAAVVQGGRIPVIVAPRLQPKLLRRPQGRVDTAFVPCGEHSDCS
jgi:hypothetical protein